MKKATVTFKAVISYKFKKYLKEIIEGVIPTTEKILLNNKTKAKIEKFEVKKIIKRG